MRTVRLTEVAMIERARKGVVYDRGCILIQLSASRGQCWYLEESSEVGQQYAVVTVNKGVNAYYLWTIMVEQMPKFVSQWRTGINIQEDTLKFFEVTLCDKAKQDEIADKVRKIHEVMEAEAETLEGLKRMKNSMLSNMFI